MVDGKKGAACLALGVLFACASLGSAEHRVLMQGNRKLAIVERDGKVSWEMPWGGIHDLHVLPNGHIYCWGRGNEGQLGNGAQNSYASPVAVQHLTSATQISVGDKHTCATTNTGRAFCWGLGTHGQLGHDNRTSHAAPVAVSGVENVAEVHAGANHTCARTTAGQVYCWGRGHEGELGNGMSHLVRAPVQVRFP